MNIKLYATQLRISLTRISTYFSLINTILLVFLAYTNLPETIKHTIKPIPATIIIITLLTIFAILDYNYIMPTEYKEIHKKSQYFEEMKQTIINEINKKTK